MPHDPNGKLKAVRGMDHRGIDRGNRYCPSYREAFQVAETWLAIGGRENHQPVVVYNDDQKRLYFKDHRFDADPKNPDPRHRFAQRVWDGQTVENPTVTVFQQCPGLCLRYGAWWR